MPQYLRCLYRDGPEREAAPTHSSEPASLDTNQRNVIIFTWIVAGRDLRWLGTPQKECQWTRMLLDMLSGAKLTAS